MSCPTLTTTSHCISATVCVILFFAKKCQIEEVIINSSSFLRPMPFSAKFDVRLYSILMFLLLGFPIIVEFITNSLQITQWDRHLYRTRFTQYADYFLDRHQNSAIFGYIFHFDLVLQHLFAVILLIAKVIFLLIFLHLFLFKIWFKNCLWTQNNRCMHTLCTAAHYFKHFASI